ncbi:nuclear transport factor 2 family protein [Paenibacillus sp. 28ISP30-2]|nr:nuclear transport factor 2 family protein [Paenibacillus sp. 28ISP30-2]
MLNKEANLEAHRSGVLQFTAIQVLDQKVILLNDTAVTVTRVSLRGTVGNEPIEDKMCYARVWHDILLRKQYLQSL